MTPAPAPAPVPVYRAQAIPPAVAADLFEQLLDQVPLKGAQHKDMQAALTALRTLIAAKG